MLRLRWQLRGLGSTNSPATAEEAIARADKLYEAKSYSEALRAYNDAFAKFPALAKTENQLRRGISAANARMTSEAVAALNSVPSSAGEMRAEALYYLAQTYARARQWEQAENSLKSCVVLFQRARLRRARLSAPAKSRKTQRIAATRSYFLRTAVSSAPGSAEVAQAQFDLAWLAHEAKELSGILAALDGTSRVLR